MRSGVLVHSMVAHNDSVTTIAVDPNGLYLLSGSHDASIRYDSTPLGQSHFRIFSHFLIANCSLWGFESRTCVQEMTAHRPKFNEAVHSAAFHSNKGTR